MNQRAALKGGKKKGMLVKKFRSPTKNKGIGLQIKTRSSAELAKNFVNESKKKTIQVCIMV